ncbi:MAG: diguanylate cyclase, partial [Azoarcus sp.]|nr:diguanylate cyclase [Azoarcus sp.]
MSFNLGKTLNFKVSLFFIVVLSLLIVILSAISLYAFRQFSINTATEHLRTAAEITRVHLTEAMITGVIDQRQSFLLRLAEVQNLKSAYVVRSPLIDQQYGQDRKGEYMPNEFEKDVLQSGEPRFDFFDNNGEIIFRGTIPYIARDEGSPNCLQCHSVPPGSVLGAITMTMSVTALRHNALLTVTGIIGVVIVCVLILFILLHYLLRPISNTAEAVENATQKAIAGNFKSHIEKQTNDEIGKIADDMNRLLRFLDSGLNKIGDHITQLIDRKPMSGENLLLATIDMVEHLTQISHYKMAIEEDEAKIDVYRRLVSTIDDRFFQSKAQYSIYEIANDKSALFPILIDDEQTCCWCNQQILTAPEKCRVFHTGHPINGIIQPDICYSFIHAKDGEKHYPMCFPIFQSGIVGSVLQLVVRESEKENILAALPYISAYLRDTAPVLEVRRLMETLKESTLRDPLTGLNNRR